jgi:transposase
LEDWVAADHPARFVREFVEALDVAGLGFHSRTTMDGRPHYAAELLVKVWVFGYVNGIRSLRKLERACRENVGLMWLCGLNEPAHNTLWRFWRDNRAALRQLFKAVIQVAVQGQLVEVVLHAVDGTKIGAQGSQERVRKRAPLAEGLERVDAAVEEVMEQIEAAAREEEGSEGYRLPPGWREQMLQREQRRELVGACEVEGRQTIHEAERDARFMKTRREGIALAYKAQTVVDSGSGLIVAEDVITDETDHHVLVPMIEQATENVGQVADETVADAGYCSGEQLQRAEERGYGVVVNEPRETAGQGGTEQEYDAVHFRSQAARDCCICPRGKELPFERIKSMGTGHGGGEQMRLYRCRQFRDCPVRWQCSRDAKGRTVSVGRFHGPMARQREKRRAAETQALLRQRKQIVEPSYGFIKEVLGFRRFTVAGLDQVRVQWALICTAFIEPCTSNKKVGSCPCPKRQIGNPSCPQSSSGHPGGAMGLTSGYGFPLSRE